MRFPQAEFKSLIMCILKSSASRVGASASLFRVLETPKHQQSQREVMGAGQNHTRHVPRVANPLHSMEGQLFSTTGMVRLSEAADTEELSQESRACR